MKWFGFGVWWLWWFIVSRFSGLCVVLQILVVALWLVGGLVVEGFWAWVGGVIDSVGFVAFGLAWWFGWDCEFLGFDVMRYLDGCSGCVWFFGFSCVVFGVGFDLLVVWLGGVVVYWLFICALCWCWLLVCFGLVLDGLV